MHGSPLELLFLWESFVSMKVFRFLSFIVALGCVLDGVHGQQLIVTPLSGEVNTGAQETAPVIARDGSRLFFTRAGDPDFNRTLIEDSVNLHETLREDAFLDYLGSIFSRLAGKGISDPVASDFNQDIFVASLSESGEVLGIEHPGYPLNNALPNSAAALTPFDNELVVVNVFPPDGGLRKGYSVCRKDEKAQWSVPEPMSIDRYRNSGTDATLAMSNDGGLILYSMEGPDSKGGADLFVSWKRADGSWTPPLNLGDQINTPHEEVTPFLSDDNGSLFFSSNRPGSAGGKDIYVAFRLDDSWQSWTPARRMKAPVNSSADDSQPWFNAHTGNLFFASNRTGNMDIFRSQIAPPNPIVVKVRGQVYNARTLKPIGAKVSVAPVSGPAAGAATVLDAPDGSFELSVRKGHEMALTASRTGYKTARKTFFFKTSYVYRKTYEFQLFIDPLGEGMQITLADTLYFNQSTPELLRASWPALGELADFLVANPGVSIRIEGHTDNVGDPAQLMRLSEQRAEAVKSWLVDKGAVNASRMSCAGFGADRPRNDNSTEPLRRQNRRVEVIITSTSFDDSSQNRSE